MIDLLWRWVVRPIMLRMDPEQAHELALRLLEGYQWWSLAWRDAMMLIARVALGVYAAIYYAMPR